MQAGAAGVRVVGPTGGDQVFLGSIGVRFQWHTFWNAGDEPCRILEIISPAGFEQYFRELAAMGGPLEASPEQFARLVQRYGFESRPETIPELLQRFGLRMGEPLSGGWMP